MDKSNNTMRAIDIALIEQLAFPGNMDIYQDIEYFDVTATDKYKEANFCLIPPYCLIEDKEQHIRQAV